MKAFLYLVGGKCFRYGDHTLHRLLQCDRDLINDTKSMSICSVTSSLQGINSESKVVDEDFLPDILDKKKNKDKRVFP